MTSTPWAILLCKFQGEPAEPYSRDRFEEIFTAAGNGRYNMVDYFDTISHGKADLNGSRVFPAPETGWYQLPQPRSAYLGFDTKPDGRNSLLTWARQAAADNGDDLSQFVNTVVVTNVAADLYGGPAGVATDDGRNPVNGMTSLSPSLLGQEMAHGFGLAHARIQGSTADYMDPFDIMSTASAAMAPHPVYTDLDVRAQPVWLVGPGLNAATMAAKGWLDLSRVWTAGSDRTSTVTLRPLHRRDLPGHLCARIDDYFVEFRMNDRWDAGLAAPAVLVHDYFDGHSYLQTTPAGATSMVAGDFFADGDVSDNPSPVHRSGTKISVTAVDATAQTATVEVQRWEDGRPSAGAGAIFGGVDVGAGGWIIVNGRVLKVPPRSPLTPMLEHLAEASAAESLRHEGARDLVRQSAFSALAGLASELAADRAVALHSPATDPLGSAPVQHGHQPQT